MHRIEVWSEDRWEYVAPIKTRHIADTIQAADLLAQSLGRAYRVTDSDGNVIVPPRIYARIETIIIW